MSEGKGREPVVVYTCVAGNYERELAPGKPEAGVRYVCFTDSKRLKAPGWEILPPQSPARLTSGHDINRFHKFFPHRLFPETRWSVYHDGNLEFTGDPRSLVQRVEQAGAGLGAFMHPAGHDLAQEVEACRRLKFDRRDMAVIDRQLALYAQSAIDPSLKIPTNWLLVRDHHDPGLPGAMSLWWSHLFEFCKRDQISLVYALDRFDVRWQALDGEGGIDPALLKMRWHQPPLLFRIRNRLRKRFNLIS